MTERLLRRIAGRAAEVTRAWEGKIAVLIASGPSLTREQIETVRKARDEDRCRVIAINDNYLVAPWADVLYFADYRWWKWHSEGRAKHWPWASFSAEQVRKSFAAFPGEKVTIEHLPMAEDDAISTLKNEGPEGLPKKPTGLTTGSNSGFQALCIAVHSGANPILMLGYDFRFRDGKSHAHNGHELKHPEDIYKSYERRFATLEIPLRQRGIKVVNCSPGTALTRFGTGAIEDHLTGERHISAVSA